MVWGGWVVWESRQTGTRTDKWPGEGPVRTGGGTSDDALAGRAAPGGTHSRQGDASTLERGDIRNKALRLAVETTCLDNDGADQYPRAVTPDSDTAHFWQVIPEAKGRPLTQQEVGLVEQNAEQEGHCGYRARGQRESHTKGDARHRCVALGDLAEAGRVFALRLAGLDCQSPAARAA